MPPLLSSLATALRATAHPPPPPTSDQHVVALNLGQAHQLPTHPPVQHPAVALCVAYTLFLVGRGSIDAPDPPPRPPQRLAVHVDLRSHHGSVTAQILSGPAVRSVHQQTHPLPVLSPPPDPIDLAHASDLRAAARHIAIVTTAAMPWMTGTSVNPALRAAYLAKDSHYVTLIVPWLSSQDEQTRVFSTGSPTFETQQQQRQHIQNWLTSQVPGVSVDVLFYNGVFSGDFGSILPVGAITDVFATNKIVKDVCILEEPEHLTWHHTGKIWTEMFTIVIGIIHTNYIEYARDFGFFGPQKAIALLFLNMWVCRGYCHRIIKLSDAVQEFPNSVTSNVHGVRERFISIGRNRSGPFPHGAYFMGKVLWAKGYRDIVDHMVEHYDSEKESLQIDFFGAGPDVAEVQAEIDEQPGLSAVTFDARVADPTGECLRGYKVFVNASRSDVVCTATAEALAMGKFVVCLDHPSNQFFSTFPNCITYQDTCGFARAVKYALSTEPKPLSSQDAYRLSWEAATERLYDAMRLPLSRRKPSKVGQALASAHATLSKIYPQPGKGIQKAMSLSHLPSST